MFCNKCGHQNEEGHFCSNCGTPLNVELKSSRKQIWLWTGISSSVIIFIALCIGIYSLIQITFSSTTTEDSAQIEVSNEILEKNDQSTPNQIQVEKDKTLIIKEAMPKVFTIFAEDSMGSGFLYKKGGYIITNAHVVAGYTDVIIRNSAGDDSKGKVIGISDEYDIALIQGTDYRHAEPLLMDTNESDIGLEVIALGSPQGFENSASIGYLTGIGRDIEFGFTYTNLYQVDAQIDHGSSGGPLLDAASGKVIGINSLLYTNQNNFAFSIPVYSMMDLVDSWISKPMSDYEISRVIDIYQNFEFYEDAAGDGYNEEDYYYFEEVSLEEFIWEFGDYYEIALYEDDFYWIEDMLLPGTEIYDQMETYVSKIAEEGYLFESDSFEVTKIEVMKDYAVVSTNETFYLTNAQKKTSFFEQEKKYTVVMDDEGYYQISEVTVY